jgi:putative methionine-R-sulfoxide reductase with GAF domain
MDEPRLLDELGGVLRSADTREAKAVRIAETIRSAGDYRWVGIYAVSGEQIAVSLAGAVLENQPIPVSRSPRASAARRSPLGRLSSWAT